MPAPAIDINAPYILVTVLAGDSSPLGVVRQTVSKQEITYGTVEKIYPTCDSVIVGDIVLFDKLDPRTRSIYYGSTQYYLIDFNLVVFKETPAP